MKVLILGASGFLGGTIYSKIKNSGNEVLGTYSKNNKNRGFIIERCRTKLPPTAYSSPELSIVRSR
ncbi:MAG: NAD(P)-dependent oxidoreductase [Pseudobutyrivibrio sp.]|nr:NAD(P)-dependent oxidoreductase [Pseudobutyrivibrio sp.]